MSHSPVLFDVRPAAPRDGSKAQIGIEVRKRDDTISYVCHSEGLSISELRSAVEALAHAAKAL